MPMEKHIIFGVHVSDRIRHVPEIQKLLTEYGCNIKTRIGLHEVEQGFCSANGIMVLEMFGERQKCYELFEKLNALEGVKAKDMVFNHP